jgi:hypothetical protein
MSGDTTGRLVGAAIAALAAPLYFLVAHFGNENRAFVVVTVVMVFATIICVLRKHVLRTRLLLPLTALFVIELSTAFLLPLPSKVPGFVMVPISLGDYVLLVWILSLFDRKLGGYDDNPDAEGPRYSA